MTLGFGNGQHSGQRRIAERASKIASFPAGDVEPGGEMTLRMALATGTWGHRSVFISPRTRKMGVKSTFYNQASVLRTIKGIFGASGLTRTEVLSTPGRWWPILEPRLTRIHIKLSRHRLTMQRIQNQQNGHPLT